jgi:hypothetical protein
MGKSARRSSRKSASDPRSAHESSSLLTQVIKAQECLAEIEHQASVLRDSLVTITTVLAERVSEGRSTVAGLRLRTRGPNAQRLGKPSDYESVNTCTGVIVRVASRDILYVHLMDAAVGSVPKKTLILTPDQASAAALRGSGFDAKLTGKRVCIDWDAGTQTVARFALA